MRRSNGLSPERPQVRAAPHGIPASVNTTTSIAPAHDGVGASAIPEHPALTALLTRRSHHALRAPGPSDDELAVLLATAKLSLQDGIEQTPLALAPELAPDLHAAFLGEPVLQLRADVDPVHAQLDQQRTAGQR